MKEFLAFGADVYCIDHAPALVRGMGAPTKKGSCKDCGASADGPATGGVGLWDNPKADPIADIEAAKELIGQDVGLVPSAAPVSRPDFETGLEEHEHKLRADGEKLDEIFPPEIACSHRRP